MSFDLAGFLRFTYYSLFKSGATKPRLWPKRLLVLLLLYTIYPAAQVVIWLSFLLDDLLFPEYHDVEIDKPLFILGNPRSGTTFLHRLIARDRANFSTMSTWEIAAPSVSLRRWVRGLSRLDRRLGGLINRRLRDWEGEWHEEAPMHQVLLKGPEEDEHWHLHIWSTVVVWVAAALIGKDTMAYTRFDTDLPPERKRRIMRYYRHCVHRHLYAHRPARHYLSKTPSFCPKVDSLLTTFPDARFVYLARNPLDVIPSFISLLDFQWRFAFTPRERFACRDYVLDMAEHWYDYPLQILDRAPPDRVTIIRFDDLVADARATLTRIYEHLGYDLSPEFGQVLQQATQRSRAYRSRHLYDLEEMGLSREGIVERFSDVFERFGFDTSEEEPSSS